MFIARNFEQNTQNVGNKSFYTIQDKSATEADILVYGVIGDPWEDKPITASSFYNDFKRIEAQYDRINVRINSPGGSVWEGFPISNLISGSKKEIHTYNDGLAASMGAVLLLSVPTNRRHSAKNALTMIHASSTMAFGSAKNLRETADLLEKIDNSLSISIAQNSELDKEEIKKNWMDGTDHWFSAEEAMAEGLLNVEDYEGNPKSDVRNMKLIDIINLYSDSSEKPENMFARLLNSFSSVFNLSIENNNQTIITMENVKNITDLLGLKKIELTEGKAMLSADDVTKIEAKLAEITNLQNDLKVANEAKASLEKSLADAKNEIEAEKAETKKVSDAFEAFKAGDAEKETIAAKKRDEELKRKQDEIDNLPHNRAADNIL